MSHDLIDLTLKRYEVTTHRLNAVDQWASGFVSLYFVFCAALITAAGFTIAMLDEKLSFDVLRYHFQTRVFALLCISAIGLLVSLWAPAMAGEWLSRRKRLIRHIIDLEEQLNGFESELRGADVSRNRMHEWNKHKIVDKVTLISTAAVLFISLLWWAVLFANSIYLLTNNPPG